MRAPVESVCRSYGITLLASQLDIKDEWDRELELAKLRLRRRQDGRVGKGRIVLRGRQRCRD